MKTLTKLYYQFMFDLCDLIMWAMINDRDHYARWWEASEYYRRKRDSV